MAAGLSIKESDLGRFQTELQGELRRLLQPEDLEDCIYSDGELETAELVIELAEAIHAGGPWGQAFPEPVFDGVFELLDHRIVGEHHLKMTLGQPGQDRRLEAIAFYIREDLRPAGWRTVQLAYRLGINEYQGRHTLQLVVERLEPVT